MYRDPLESVLRTLDKASCVPHQVAAALYHRIELCIIDAAVNVEVATD
jgi:hypothetical protein